MLIARMVSDCGGEPLHRISCLGLSEHASCTVLTVVSDFWSVSLTSLPELRA